MPAVYEFVCPTCKTLYEFLSRDQKRCPRDGTALRRKFSFSAPKLFEPHFNHAVGRYVTSAADFRAALSEASDKATETTGIEHNFVPVDYREVKANLPNEDGLYEQQKARVDNGS